MKKGIILIGPEKAGKTTVGQQLAAALNLPFHDLANDTVQFRTGDTDTEKLVRIYTNEGYEAVLRYRMPARAGIVVRALAHYEPAVVELPALYTFFDREPMLGQVQPAMRAYGRTILLLPSPDMDRSVQILAQRRQTLYHGLDWNEYFIRHPSNRRLAKQIIYTKDRTPAETCAAIMARLDHTSADVFLLGPVGAGKTTIGRLLAQQLQRPQASLDGLRWRCYQEIGYDEAEQKRIMAAEGLAGVLDYWKRFDLHAIERLLAEHRDCIVDFGAGQTVFTGEAELVRLQRLLAPYPNVFLLLPSADLDESVAILHQRRQRQTAVQGVELNRFLINTYLAQGLASLVVYTEQKTAAETRDEIIRLLAERYTAKAHKLTFCVLVASGKLQVAGDFCQSNLPLATCNLPPDEM
jgi:shikimate kinase